MKTSEFPSFFRALNDGKPPYRWQEALAARACEVGFPSVINFPADTGRFHAVIHAWLFALAFQAETAKRTVPRRLVICTNRRTIVDFHADCAAALAQKLKQATSGIVRTVANRLKLLGVGDDPFSVVALRGGKDDDSGEMRMWMYNPCQPSFISSTVDQLGSRLLFRGCGLSDESRPIPAGLLSTDTLIVPYEARLSQAFSVTLHKLQRYRTWGEVPVGMPFQVTEVRALPPEADNGDAFVYSVKKDADIGPRVKVSKPARLRFTAKAPGDLVKAAVEEAKDAAKLLQKGTVGIVLNRWRRVRDTFDQLKAMLAKSKTTKGWVELQTGRMRPADRLRQERGPGDIEVREGCRFVVCTQSVEVGSGLRFDALVTEIASLDALMQRFALLDRHGERAEPALASIIALTRQVDKDAHDLVYGDSLSHVARWLEGRATFSNKDNAVDMGIAAVYRDLPKDLTPLLSPVRPAPAMLPAMLDLWAQTSPVPFADPNPTHWLHGYEGEHKARAPDCAVVWRADLDPDNPSFWADIVSLCPPQPGEKLMVPLYVLNAWLRGDDEQTEFGDVEGETEEVPTKPSRARPRKVLLWQEDVGTLTDCPTAGSMVVVPSAYGGADQFGWCPEVGEPVADVAEEAALMAESPLLRIHRRLLPTEAMDAIREYRATLGPEQSPDAQGLLHCVIPHLTGAALDVATALAATKVSIEEYPGNAKAWLISKRPGKRGKGGMVSLEDHTRHVMSWARQFATRFALPAKLTGDLLLAEEYHDAGKQEERYQTFLRAGATKNGVLAKTPRRNWKAQRQAWKLAGLPRGFRHEIVGLSMLDPDWRKRAHDADLVEYLISSHHGYCRPFAPLVDDPEMNGEHKREAASGTADRFWTLARRYGWHGLAFLEAIARMADWQASRLEEGAP